MKRTRGSFYWHPRDGMNMQPEIPAPARGRPPTITPERLADIGIKLGLPNLTMANVAAELAVTQAALYKRVANLEALKRLVADTVFQRWQIPRASVEAHYRLTDLRTPRALPAASPAPALRSHSKPDQPALFIADFVRRRPAIVKCAQIAII